MSAETLVRVRFAPSPTGVLHVGGARTALFNWLFARKQGGIFILRIEDTDRERSTAESHAAILRGLRWLGLDWDEGPEAGGDRGPYLQSERRAIYQDHLALLRERGRVYRCYCTADEIRARAPETAVGGGYDGHCRDLSEAARRQLEAEGRSPCWRLRVPDEGSTFWYDIVCGKLEFRNEALTDRVVIKADGLPIYNFAAVVDDHLMGISHILRGDDHVSNTPIQLLIYDAFDFPRPKFGHMPMILGPDRQRLSKRHGATSVEEFAAQGVLPDAMVNYLALLGWSVGAAGDEVLTRRQLIDKFSLKKVNSSPAAFDYEKLRFINAEHFKRMPAAERLQLALPVLADRGWVADPCWQIAEGGDTATYLDRVLRILGNRFQSLQRLPGQIAFFFSEDYEQDEAAVAEHLAGQEVRTRLQALADAFAAGFQAKAPVPAARFEAIVRVTADELGVEAGQLIHPCRVALTGQTKSAGIFEVMELIGAPRVLARLRRALGS